MKTRFLCLTGLLPLALGAQAPPKRDPARLINWAAPLYWQSTAVSEAASTSAPLGTAALVFVAMTPCRVVDTRMGQGFTGGFGPPSLPGGVLRTFPIQASTRCSIPSVAQAYSLNVTVVPQGPLYYLTVYPATANPQPPPPDVSTLNAPQGNLVANAAIVAAGTDGGGSLDVYPTGPTDLILDINGYYAAPTDLNHNTALGAGALADDTTGFSNTATGADALQNNTSGYGNTASGFQALYQNNGDHNTAMGAAALSTNTYGGNNTATGWFALSNNTSASNNTADGALALQFSMTGGGNTAIGASTLNSDTSGGFNTAVGAGTLFNNTTGNYNIAIGAGAAGNVAGGNSYNIHIGSPGAALDNGVIRIGTAPSLGIAQTGGQIAFFAAGIRGVTTGNIDTIPVVIDSNGQLGTVSSSARFKEDIHDMGEASSGLLRLRPVTFRYRQPFADGLKPVQYGLIAEEVEKVYPDLVAHSADGQIESVKYQVLDSMLLNELQKQADEIQVLKNRLAVLENGRK